MVKAMSAFGPFRPFAASQRYVRYWRLSRHCADIAETAPADPIWTLPNRLLDKHVYTGRGSPRGLWGAL